MAKLKVQETEFTDSKRNLINWFDQYWLNKYGQSIHAWIINSPKATEKNIRRLACFATPDACELIGNELHFTDTAAGRVSENQFKYIFTDTLYDYEIKIYEKPVDNTSYRWENLDDRGRRLFAMAIWKDRSVHGGMPTPFCRRVQETLCRMAGAPDPDTLKAMIS